MLINIINEFFYALLNDHYLLKSVLTTSQFLQTIPKNKDFYHLKLYFWIFIK